MSPSGALSTAAPSQARWFYSLASIILLVSMLIGFRMFYLHGQAYPGRPLAPPIRTAVIIHACLMTVWILLAVIQPLLVSTKHTRLHMKLGVLGAVLAVIIVLTGLHVGIESARITPPDLTRFGLDPKEFLAVPVLSVLVFAMFIFAGVRNRKRPDIHRPMMLFASISVIGAALGRITVLNELYAGTVFEVVFSGFFAQVILTLILLPLKYLVTRSLDKWFVIGAVALIGASALISLVARTAIWDRLATFLLSY